MIIGAFRSEWIKLRRPSPFVATYVGLAAAASAFTILLFTPGHEDQRRGRGASEPCSAGAAEQAHPRAQTGHNFARHRGLRNRRLPDCQ